MKKPVALFGPLTLAILLTACPQPQPPQPVVETDPATTQPTAPVVGKAAEIQNVQAVSAQVAQAAATTFSPNNPDIDPDVKELMGLFALPGNSMMPTSAGRDMLSAFMAPVKRLRATATEVHDSALPTGTFTRVDDQSGTYFTFTDASPTDGLVLDSPQQNVKEVYEWKVGGAPTKFFVLGEGSVSGTTNQSRSELPTSGRYSIVKGGRTLASAALTIKPGSCDWFTAIEDASLNAWAGTGAVRAAEASSHVTWTDSAIAVEASATYRTAKEQASATFKADVAATSSGRCAPATSLTVKPSRMDLSAGIKVPGHTVNMTGYLRDVTNLEFSGAAMSVDRWWQKVGGTVNASLAYNGQNAVTVFGPLADGSDMDLNPGDQVKVQYVKDGVLKTADIMGALQDLEALFGGMAPRP